MCTVRDKCVTLMYYAVSQVIVTLCSQMTMSLARFKKITSVGDYYKYGLLIKSCSKCYK